MCLASCFNGYSDVVGAPAPEWKGRRGREPGGHVHPQPHHQLWNPERGGRRRQACCQTYEAGKQFTHGQISYLGVWFLDEKLNLQWKLVFFMILFDQNPFFFHRGGIKPTENKQETTEFQQDLRNCPL